ncbi:unnamed protein product, partial [Closterium sp. Naga37s-1]
MLRIASCPIPLFTTSAPPRCRHHSRTICPAANGYLPRGAAEATTELAEWLDGGVLRCGQRGRRMGQLRRMGRAAAAGRGAEVVRVGEWADRRQRGCGWAMTPAARGCWRVKGRGAEWTVGRTAGRISGGRIWARAEWGESGCEEAREGGEARERGGGESESGSVVEGADAAGSVWDGCGGGEGERGSSGGGDGVCEGRRRFMMVLAYDGTHFHGETRIRHATPAAYSPPRDPRPHAFWRPFEGAQRSWQRQAHHPTVQGAVEAALVTYTRASIASLGVTGASRTDAGVHAWGQVAHFTTASPICDLPRMHRALNALLPPAIRVRSLCAVPLSFHARLHPCGKRYHYTVLNSPTPHLLPHRRSTLLSYSRGPLDRQLMAQAARLFEGRRDFAAFANACEAKEKGAVREITRFELVGEADCWQGVVEEGEASPVFRFEVEGSGFLYRQVRNM